jgi:hypothetical protein
VVFDGTIVLIGVKVGPTTQLEAAPVRAKLVTVPFAALVVASVKVEIPVFVPLDALELIEQNFLTTNTFESLSKKVGFTSYNPFFTSFKDVVGKSPQEYIVQLNKE